MSTIVTVALIDVAMLVVVLSIVVIVGEQQQVLICLSFTLVRTAVRPELALY